MEKLVFFLVVWASLEVVAIVMFLRFFLKEKKHFYFRLRQADSEVVQLMESYRQDYEEEIKNIKKDRLAMDQKLSHQIELQNNLSDDLFALKTSLDALKQTLNEKNNKSKNKGKRNGSKKAKRSK